MDRARDRQIALGAISDPQRCRVESHMNLVHTTLARFGSFNGEPQDLRQEGCLALVEAIRSHNPARHGPFAPYAMSRIRFAISRYAHENSQAVRVPFITQRRRSSARRSAGADRHDPGPLPRVFRLGGVRTSPHRPDVSPVRSDVVTVAELVRDRYLRIVRRVARRMKHAPHRRSDRTALIDFCLVQRWSIPREEARTSFRQLARILNCSLGRITHCEEEFNRRLADALRADPAFRRLYRLARAHPAGLDHRVSKDECLLLGKSRRARTR